MLILIGALFRGTLSNLSVFVVISHFFLEIVCILLFDDNNIKMARKPGKKLHLVVDVNNFENGRKPVKLQKESPAGCAGESNQSKGN